MSANGKWMRSYWTKRGARVNPTKPGWYAAVPEDCDRCVEKVFIYPNLLDCYVEGRDNKYDVYDFRYWYPLKSENDRLPEFRE